MLRRLIFLLCVAPLVQAAPLDEALALFKAGKLSAARTAFEELARAEPANLTALLHLGLIHQRENAPDAALPWLEKAVAAAPSDSMAQTTYGEVCLAAASLHTSLGLAFKGRAALEAAIAANPDNLEAREALMQYYQQAPFGMRDRDKAKAQLEEIRRRDADLGAALSIKLLADAKDYAAAFKLCDELIAKNAKNYTALYAYARTANLSGQNLTSALDHLETCLALIPPNPASPGHSYVYSYIGAIREKLTQPAEAKKAYARALELDPHNARAVSGLARVK